LLDASGNAPPAAVRVPPLGGTGFMRSNMSIVQRSACVPRKRGTLTAIGCAAHRARPRPGRSERQRRAAGAWPFLAAQPVNVRLPDLRYRNRSNIGGRIDAPEDGRAPDAIASRTRWQHRGDLSPPHFSATHFSANAARAFSPNFHSLGALYLGRCPRLV